MRFLRPAIQMTNFATRLVLLVACACAIVIGTWLLTDYSNRPGRTCHVAQDLNLVLADSKLPIESLMNDSRCSLILFYHPHCPCTQATVRCLERLHTRFIDPPNFLAVAFCPDTEDDLWIESSTTATLKNIGPTQIIIDRDGEFCTRFGICTSGHAVVYDDSGKLIFSGGITPGRGHEGACQAATDLLTKINGQPGELVFWPVYGCQIIEPEVRP